ncbi:helix-turn-helix domain-containing protein [Peribacillus frigoritolerans]|uniref:helix-turn-helix domain-containing protein n=1 Tax=Peribacillus frigoritolerans TaxID=450367 RepID=UPI003D08A856
MTNINSNLKQILDQRNISIRQVSRDIDYRFDSVRQLYNNENKNYPRELLTKLCVYLNVTPGELLVLEIEDPDC